MSNEELSNQLKLITAKIENEQMHRKDLKKDLDLIIISQREIVSLIAGNDLNGKKGMVSFMDKLTEKVDKLDAEISLMKQTVENSKFWGKTAIGVLASGILLILRDLFHK